MKTAHNVKHTRPMVARDSHLIPANEPQPASEIRRLADRSWRYVKAEETDIRRTFARLGWAPTLRGMK